MSRPERTVGSYLRASQAAERALDQGEELEDTLWMGSGRLDGSLVRRQFLLRQNNHNNNSQRSSSSRSRRRLGSQRFLQSMRYLNLNLNHHYLWRRTTPTTTNHDNTSLLNRSSGNTNHRETDARLGRRQDSQNNSSSRTNHDRRDSDQSNHTTTTTTNVLRNFGRRDSDNSHYHHSCNPLEYNGGKEASTRMVIGDINATVVMNAAKKTRTTLLQASQGYDSNNTNNNNNSSASHPNRRSEVTRLLSMRCEASRSMRRQQRGVGQMVQWLMDEPVVAATLEAGKHTAAAAATVAADTGRRLPFRKHHRAANNNNKNTDNNDTRHHHHHHHQRLTKSTLTRETVAEEGAPVPKHKEGKRKHKKDNLGTKWNPLRWSKSGHDRQKKNKNKLSLSMASRGSSASSMMNDDDHFDMGPISPVVPVHVQLARSQKRNDALHRGSRHLENDTNSSSDDNNTNINNNTNSSEFGGDSGRHDPLEALPSGRNAMGRYNELRSTRLSINSNQPLLVRRRGERISFASGGHGGMTETGKSRSDDDDDDDDSSADDDTGLANRSATAFHRKGKKNKKSQNRRNNNTEQAQAAAESTRFYPHLRSEINTNNNRSSRGNLLVNQFSGLSVVGCNDDSDGSDDNFYSVQELIDSTRADVANSARSSGKEGDEEDDHLPLLASETSGASYFMQTQGGFGGNQLECLEEEREGDLTESEHRSNHYGPDQNFGRSTFESSLSSLLKLKKNDDSDSENSHDFYNHDIKSSGQSHDRDSGRKNDNSYPSVTMENDSGRSHGSMGRRKTLPPNALGGRQNAMRGGLMTECAKEALREDHQRRRSSLPLEIELSSSTLSLDNNVQRTAGNGEKGDISGTQRDTTTGNEKQEQSESNGEGREVVLHDNALPSQDPGEKEWWQVASDDGSDIRQTQVFCENLLDDWDSRMEKDANKMAVFSDEEWCDEYSRSVASEPADIGVWEPLMMSDPAECAWVFAWDDLALL